MLQPKFVTGQWSYGRLQGALISPQAHLPKPKVGFCGTHTVQRLSVEEITSKLSLQQKQSSIGFVTARRKDRTLPILVTGLER